VEGLRRVSAPRFESYCNLIDSKVARLRSALADCNISVSSPLSRRWPQASVVQQSESSPESTEGRVTSSIWWGEVGGSA